MERILDFKHLARLGLVLALGAAQGAVAADFDGDGRADLVWRDAGGHVAYWTLDGFQRLGRAVTGITRDPAWALAGTGDFNGDGRSDLLWVRADGTIELWQTGTLPQSDVYVLGAKIPPGYRWLGTGTFNADNRTDALWLDPVNGQLVVWNMTSGGVSQAIPLFLAPPASWSLLAVGDLSGDGLADVAWLRDDRRIEVWRINGSSLLHDLVSDAAVPADYALAGSGDLDNDGRTDLVWRNGQGAYVVWFMDGAAHTEAPLQPDALFSDRFEGDLAPTPAPPLTDAAWTLLDVADFDGDGHNDIAAADANGNVRLLRLQGNVVLGASDLAADADMPYPGLTGWTLPPERPVVTRYPAAPGSVEVAWTPIPGMEHYRLFASPQPEPAATGTTTEDANSPTVLAFDGNSPASARYFALATVNHGLVSPPSREAYLAEFRPYETGYVGEMAMGDFNGDGCIDVVGALNDCHGGFLPRTEADMGLGAINTAGRAWRDLRLADFDGDGIDDVVSNVYAPLTDANSQALLFRGVGAGQFQLDTAFSALDIRGFGETIVVADFNNDGAPDIFLPHYTQNSPAEHNYLLINDGSGHFTDIADAAGVAMRNWPGTVRVEGAQAIDINDDGWIDLYVGSHLFINQGTAGGLHFADQAYAAGLPLQFEEGAKFIDWNNDGLLDLVTQHPYLGPSLYQNTGTGFFNAYGVLPLSYWNNAYGLSAGDMDGDGRPDIVIAGGCGDSADNADGNCFDSGSLHALPHLYVNRGGSYAEHYLYDDGRTAATRGWNDLQAVGDLDDNGTLDLVSRFYGPGGTAVLQQAASDLGTLVVRVVDASGRQNQQGRVVRVTPLARPGFVMTQVVDGGSGYLSTSRYDLTFATPVAGLYEVDVRFATGTHSALVKPGSVVTMAANGSIQIAPR